tara:strand:- start:495 stop:707 length:213 start_codon:yes stop_codon:yes gene_type:complete
MSKDKRKINLQDYGPVSSFSTSIISGLLVGLFVQNFIGFEPYTVIFFIFIGFYDGFRRMWKISKKLEQEQ